MNINKITLAFFDDNEGKFLSKYHRDSLLQFRLSFILVIFLYGVFGYLDTLVAGEYVRLFHIIRYAVVIPIFVLVFVLSYFKLFEKIWQGLLFVSFVIAGAGITIMTIKVPDNYSYYAGMMLIFSAGYFLIKLRFFYATLAGWITLVLFNFGALFYSEMDSVTIINNNFFFISANIIGMFAAYNIEYFARRDFFLNTELDNRNMEIEEVNISLESKVKERTIELEEALEKAEQSDVLKSAFLANMSHEIRTPMNGILGFAELLKEPKLTGEEQQEFISIIEKSGLRMLNIINDLIDISKVEAGEMQVVSASTNINEQIGYIFALFNTEVETKKLNLTYHKGLSDKEAIIQSDPEKIYAILTNLVKNAIKFTRKGTIDFGYIKKSNELEFFVKDTGIGIPESKFDDIFNRFVQADIEDKQAFQGAGLGLSITRAYIELLGGKIWVESEEGKGSQFYFTIPYIKKEDESHGKDAPDGEPDQNLPYELKILVAEDDYASEKLLSIILRDISSDVIYVNNGQKAIDVCRNNSDIDLILMDIKMPLVNGLEATRQIRLFNSDVVIIAQTSYVLSGDRDEAIEAGCTDYISKPINIKSLRELINQYLGPSEDNTDLPS